MLSESTWGYPVYKQVNSLCNLYSAYTCSIWLKETCKCWNQSLKMPKATRKSAHVTNTSKSELQEDSNLSQESSSEDEVVIQSPQYIQPSPSQSQVVQPIYMPYIKGPKMDWTVNDSLYHRFLKWKIKRENILDCELEMLSEARKCTKVVAWSEDSGID